MQTLLSANQSMRTILVILEKALLDLFMVAITIVNAVIRDLFKEKIEKSRVQKTVMFSLLKDYKCQLPQK